MVATVEAETKPEANGSLSQTFKSGSAVWYQPEDKTKQRGPAEVVTTVAKGILIRMFVPKKNDPSESLLFTTSVKTVDPSELSPRTKSLAEILCDGGIGE